MQSIYQQAQPGAHRILIAEDHGDSREAMRALFEAFGYEVCEAVNGREAVDRAVVERPNLILMDIMMPEVDGIDATRMIREIPELETTPIIAVTAMEGADKLALAAGIDDYVRKPVDIRALLTKVSGWLEQDAA